MFCWKTQFNVAVPLLPHECPGGPPCDFVTATGHTASKEMAGRSGLILIRVALPT